MTARMGKLAAYSSEVRDLLRARPFERASAPSGPRLFRSRLQRKDEGRRQRVLTARLGVQERILELLEGGVGGNGVSHVLCPLLVERVVREAANEGRGQVLRGIDSKAGGARAHT